MELHNCPPSLFTRRASCPILYEFEQSFETTWRGEVWVGGGRGGYIATSRLPILDGIYLAALVIQSNHEWNRGQLGIRPGFARFFLCFSAFGVGCFCSYFAVLCIGTYGVFPCMASFSHLASVSSCFLAVFGTHFKIWSDQFIVLWSVINKTHFSMIWSYLYNEYRVTQLRKHLALYLFRDSLIQVLGCKLWEVSGPVYDFRQIKWQLVLWMIKRSSCPALDSVLVCMYQKSTAFLFSSFWTIEAFRKCLGMLTTMQWRCTVARGMSVSTLHSFMPIPLSNSLQFWNPPSLELPTNT